jgi:heptosyltransferase-2
LVVLVENIGDVLLAAGFLRDLRAHYCESHISLIVSSDSLAVASSCPYVDDVLGINVAGSAVRRAFVGPLRAWAFAKRNLWSRKFDMVLNPRWDVDSRHGSLLGLYSLGAQHVGFCSKDGNARKRVINRGLDRAFSYVSTGVTLCHDAERGGELLESVGICSGSPICEVWMLPEDLRFGDEELNDSSRLLIAFGVGASQRKRQWPVRRFIDLAELLILKYPNASFLVVGNKQDAAIGEEIKGFIGDRLLNYAGRCTVLQSASLLKHCRLYIGADSGPMHIAAAVGVPVVDISCHPVTGAQDHANSPRRYHPVNVPYVVLQPANFTYPCSYACSATDAHCILSITTSRAFSAALQLLH